MSEINPQPFSVEKYQFLIQGGKTGKLMFAKNWNQTSLGTIDSWPQNLYTTLGVLISTKLPMLLLWGPDLICFYNDAYMEMAHINENQMQILGKSAPESLIKMWPIIKSSVGKVFKNGKALEENNKIIPVYNTGKNKSLYGTFHYSMVHGETVSSSGILITYTNIKKEDNKKTIYADSQFNNLIKQTSNGICILWGPNLVVEIANETYLQIVDKRESELIGKPLFESLPTLKKAVAPLLSDVLNTGITYQNGAEFPVTLNRYGKKEVIYFNFTYQAIKTEDGTIAGIMVIANDVTSLIKAKHSLAESEEQFRKIVMESPIPMTILRGYDYVIEMANTEMLKNIWGKKEPDVIGKKLLDVFPELKDQKYPALLNNVLTTGKTYTENESVTYVKGKEGLKKFYLDYVYNPLFKADNSISGVMVTIRNVTKRVEARRIVEDAETRLRLAAEGTGLATWDLDLTTKQIIYSPKLLELFGHSKTKVLTYQGMHDQVHPEDIQIVEKALEEAIKTDIYDYEARIIRPDKSIRWVRTQGKVIYDDKNIPSRIIGTVRDITEQKDFITALEKSEQRLNIAVNAAELGTWEIDLINKHSIFSKKYLQILGYDENDHPSHEELIQKIHPDDLHIRSEALKSALQNSIVDFEVRIKPDANNIKWIKAKGKIFYNGGKPVRMMGIIMDITEQKLAFNSLLESEERFRTIAYTAPVMIWMADINRSRYFFNKGWLDFTGRPLSQELGNGWIENIHPDDVKPYIDAYLGAFNTQKEFYIEYRLKRYDGQYRWVSAKGVPRYTINGVFIGLIGCCTDIDESKTISDKLRESETKYRQLVESMPAAVYTCDTEGRILLYNEASTILWGRIPDIEKDLWSGALKMFDVEGKLLKVTQLPIATALEYKQAYEMEAVIERPDGTKRNILAYARPVYDNNEKIIGGIQVGIDITERKLAELLLQQSEQKFRLLADFMPQQIWTSDPTGNLNYFNKSVYDYSGLSFEQIKNEGWLKIVHPEDRDENIRKWMHAIATGEDFNCEHRFKRHDGEYRWQLSRALPQKDSKGDIKMWVGTSTDIHEIKETEQQKDFFISMASHELKTPITSVKGYVQILQSIYNDSKDDFLKNSLAKVDNQIIRLTKLIGELLDLSKIKAGSLQLNKELFYINTMVKEVIDEIQHIEPDYKINFWADSKCIVYADKERISQVLINFLTNAIKYSPHSTTINVKSVVIDNYVIVSVEDTGIGISKVDQQKIFQRFYRAEGKSEKTFPGFGIGLFIASEIIQRHNGKIGVDSILGKGSVFYFSLPL